MPRILHTADWQIGKPYRWVDDGQKQARLQQERVEVVGRIAEIVRQEQVDAVLVAGDLFDSSTVPAATVMEVLEVVGSMSCPVLVIPGNHDHGGVGGIWRREDLQRQMQDRAPNLQLLLSSEPVLVAGITVLPCPLLRQHESRNPLLWLEQLDWQALDSSAPRVVLAHGSVQGFGGDDSVNRLALDRLPSDELDYVALGDWHGLMSVNRKVWYAGTPEPDRFPNGPDDKRSQVLLVDLERGLPAGVKPHATGRFQWHRITMTLKSDGDLARLEQRMSDCFGRRVGRDLLRLELNGQLGWSAHQNLQNRLEDLQQQLLHLRLRGELHRLPTAHERDQFLDGLESPLVSAIASDLQEELEQAVDPVAEQALIELQRLCAIDPCA
ncbi:calcineurin-like phosphoesterase family protein [Synechococcus sp. NOUM97013]|nr:calcineurin-like phosphoesterase family protein [Synechococcus sp. NOUM97013]